MRWLAFILWFTVAAHAMAGAPQPVLDLDFTRSDTVDPRITVSRAASVTGFNCASPQALVTFAPNTAATHLCDENGNSLGLAAWSQRQFDNVYARDLTQAPAGIQIGWTPTNVTVARTQTGIDLQPNTATLVTATANNGTICQQLVNVGGLYRLLTAYIKRVSGTGAIWISQDAVNWTEVDGRVTSGRYARVPAGGLLQSVFNPNLCIKLGTSGDSIAVDYVNLENDRNLTLTGPSTPMFLGAASPTTVPADIVTIPFSSIPGIDPNQFTVIAKASVAHWYGQAPLGSLHGLFDIDDGTTNNVMEAYFQSTALIDRANNDFAVDAISQTGSIKTRCSSVPASQLSWLTAPYTMTFAVVAVGYDVMGGMGISCNNSALSGNQPETPIPGPSTIPMGAFNELVIGYNPRTIQGLSGYLQQIQIYPRKLQSGGLTALVSKLNPAVPARKPTYLNLIGGGHLLFQAGGAIQCNQC